jgi:hypothetical protein
MTSAWRRLVLYRIVPADAAEEPFTVTFALTGMGEARIDDVSVRVLERSAGGIPAAVVSIPRPAGSTPAGFPQPSDLLAGPGAVPAPLPDVGSGPAAGAVPPVAAVAPAAVPANPPAASPQWPGMNLEWPKLLPFGQSSSAPPPGPGGGTIDPFKRARAPQP